MSACRATVTSTDDGDDEGETMRIAGNERDEDFAGDVRDLVLAATRKYAMKDDRGAEGVLEIIVESVRDFAGRTLVSHVVAELVDERVAASWEHGWQPVDLDRFVGRSRRQPERDLLGDAMAARLAQFATSTIDPEWWDQLADIGARVWWSNDRNWVLARSVDEDWDALVRAAVRLLATVWLVPPIEKLGPAPGEATAATADRDRAEVDPRILERVRRLLAKAESTTFEAEAETFTAGAQSLMARYSIDAALLAASGPDAKGEEPAACRVGIENPYESQKVMLLGGIARANRCRSVWSKGLGHVTLVGHREDRLAVETLFTSLLLQATAAVAQQGRRTDRRGRSRTAAFRRSFLTAFAVRIAERLEEVTDAEVAAASARRAAGVEEAGTPGSGQELVPLLQQRREAVDAAVEEMFPSLQTSRSPTVSDVEGWSSGQLAADRASLTGWQEVAGRSW